PDVERVAERAVAVLPAGFRVIYIVRDPIDRIVSQHYHEFIEGLIGANINLAVREHPRMLNYSRYGYQLAPWIEAVGADRVQVVRFESYTADRQATIARLCEFLELPVEQLPELDVAVHNRSEEKIIKNKFWDFVQQSRLYQQGVRPLMSPRWRTQLQKWILPRGPDRPEPPSLETISWLREQLAGEVRQISDYAGSVGMLWEDYSPR
ncbi:MAG: sulfotransferase, partial [Aeoliella sp.]